jgi:ABC-type nickel/cobalt efflux system permease component RcnA
MRRCLLVLLLVASLRVSASWGHDIPNARVDRSTQATVRPGLLEVEYEVGLAELTLTKDLRNLIGTLPGEDRQGWFERYGTETGPLNAKGFFVSIDGDPRPLRFRGFNLKVEEHPRYFFHFETPIPPRGRLVIQDTNFAGSEGTSRLAVRGAGGVEVHGDDLPSDVALIPIRPVWQLSDDDERRTKRVQVDYQVHAVPSAVVAPAAPTPAQAPLPAAPSPRRTATPRLSLLLDRASGITLAGLLAIAFGLGAIHAIQPGHGKTLVAAAVVAERGSWLRGSLLGLIITLTHTGSVLLVAAGLWLSQSSRYQAVHASLARCSGFAIAAIGFWRLGRALGGYDEHDAEPEVHLSPGARGLVGLGIAGGLVPCWDAVALIVLAEAVGRLPLGVLLLLAFGAGMAAVLVAVGWTAGRFRRFLDDRSRGLGWVRGLAIAGSLVLCALGMYLMTSA